MDAAAKRDAGRCGECPYLRIEQGPGGTTCARCFDPDNREIERWYGRTIIVEVPKYEAKHFPV